MGAIPHCRETVEKRLVPSVLSIIAGDPKRLPLRLPSAAIEVLEALIRSGVTPLSEAVLLVFPALVQGILSTDDPATLAVSSRRWHA